MSSVVLDPPDIHCIEKHTSLWFEKERKPHTFVSLFMLGDLVKCMLKCRTVTKLGVID